MWFVGWRNSGGGFWPSSGFFAIGFSWNFYSVSFLFSNWSRRFFSSCVHVLWIAGMFYVLCIKNFRVSCSWVFWSVSSKLSLGKVIVVEALYWMMAVPICHCLETLSSWIVLGSMLIRWKLKHTHPPTPRPPATKKKKISFPFKRVFYCMFHKSY